MATIQEIEAAADECLKQGSLTPTPLLFAVDYLAQLKRRDGWADLDTISVMNLVRKSLRPLGLGRT